MQNIFILIIIGSSVLTSGGMPLKYLKVDEDRWLVETARQLVIAKYEAGQFDFQYCKTMKTPVLPNFNVFVFKKYFEGFIDPPPRYPYYDYVGIDTVKKIKKTFEGDFFNRFIDTSLNVTIAESLACERANLEYYYRENAHSTFDELKRKSFNEFVDTADILKINTEKEALDYAEFIINVLYQEVILNDNTDERIRLYLNENLPDSLKDYLPKAKTTPEGYLIEICACREMLYFHPSALRVYKYILRIKRNGIILEISENHKLSLPTKKETYSPLKGKKKLKPLVEIKFSDSLAARKCLKSPLPKFPEWAAKAKIVTSFKLGLLITSDGKIFGSPVILKVTGSEWWDNDIIRWLKEKWKWEKSPSGTEGTIEIHFNWTEK